MLTVLLLCLWPVETPLKFVDVPVIAHRCGEKSAYADIMNRVSSPAYGNGRWTECHESCHGIASDLRQKYGGTRKVEAMYCLNGKAVILQQPAMRKGVVAQFVPKSCRNYRFPTYVTGQPDWEDCPLHIAQEWMAYSSEAVLGYEDAQRGVRNNTDQASGTLELGIYSVAMAMAIEKYDPEYFRTNKQFREFMRYQWNRAHDIFTKLEPFYPFPDQTKQLKNLKTSPDAHDMREFIKNHLGGVWLEN